jgi:hypothetical protein
MRVCSRVSKYDVTIHISAVGAKFGTFDICHENMKCTHRIRLDFKQLQNLKALGSEINSTAEGISFSTCVFNVRYGVLKHLKKLH